MAIQFKCDSCGKSLKADDSKAGKKVKCPGCTEVITIPQLEIMEEELDDQEMDDEEDDDSPPPRRSNIKRSSAKRSSSKEHSLASPLKRLLGAFVDGFAMLLIWIIPTLAVMAIMFVYSKPGQPPTVPDSASVFALILFFGVALAVIGLNLYLYATRSQSIGKWFVKTQVMDYETDEPASFMKAFVIRSFLNQFLCVVPLYGLVDVLFVFGEENRCIHDKIAGTYVVDIS